MSKLNTRDVERDSGLSSTRSSRSCMPPSPPSPTLGVGVCASRGSPTLSSGREPWLSGTRCSLLFASVSARESIDALSDIRICGFS
jgi:hypothetical protein